jgi:hypothetical protein
LFLFPEEMKPTIRAMRVREAKDFLVAQTAEQAALEGVPLSDLEKRMMYFTETGECPEDPIALNDAFEADYDTPAYEKKISLLMARAYRRIKRESPEKLRLWNDAFRVLSRSDHYILLFWRQNTSRKSPRLWPTYVLGALAVAGLYSLVYFFFGNRRGIQLGQQAPVDKYIPTLNPLLQHTLQLLFLLTLLFAIFPQLFSKLASLLQRFFQSTLSALRQKYSCKAVI